MLKTAWPICTVRNTLLKRSLQNQVTPSLAPSQISSEGGHAPVLEQLVRLLFDNFLDIHHKFQEHRLKTTYRTFPFPTTLLIEPNNLNHRAWIPHALDVSIIQSRVEIPNFVQKHLNEFVFSASSSLIFFLIPINCINVLGFFHNKVSISC